MTTQSKPIRFKKLTTKTKINRAIDKCFEDKKWVEEVNGDIKKVMEAPPPTPSKLNDAHQKLFFYLNELTKLHSK